MRIRGRRLNQAEKRTLLNDGMSRCADTPEVFSMILRVTDPGSAPIIWEFSVRDDAVASRLEGAIAHSGRVVLTYEEHRGVPTDCFGESQYYVTGVRLIE